MKREKKNIDDILKRHLPSASREDVESARGRVLDRLRQSLAGIETAPDAVKRLRLIDEEVRTAIRMLEGKVTLHHVWTVVNELADEPREIHDISLSIGRLGRKGLISIQALFPEIPAPQGQERLGRDGLAEEKP